MVDFPAFRDSADRQQRGATPVPKSRRKPSGARASQSTASSSPASPPATATWRGRLRELYEGQTTLGRRFRYSLLAFDLATIVYVVATSFFPGYQIIEVLDVLFGIVILADFVARMAINRQPARELLHPTTWADVAAIISFLAPIIGEGVGFLRILRTLRLMRTYHLLAQLRADSRYFRRHEDVIFAVTNLAVFIFITAGVVYETQHYSNPYIHNWADALYFTVTALTTTGFGDITLPGTAGRLISVAIMIFGVTLFFNLARALINPSKVRFRCPQCGLLRHDHDAVHCKACGHILNIPDEGLD
jgi:voltage-gated potassium channel